MPQSLPGRMGQVDGRRRGELGSDEGEIGPSVAHGVRLAGALRAPSQTGVEERRGAPCVALPERDRMDRLGNGLPERCGTTPETASPHSAEESEPVYGLLAKR